ncbi:MAG: hypothetical protein L3J41_15610 [Melioribacteraceae bacterium]|nr:hypothetical protein [Melioribacteraceae bacterium]
MRNYIYYIFLYLFFAFIFISCETSLTSEEINNQLNINYKPINIQAFNSYSNENQVNLFWTTNRPFQDFQIPSPPNVEVVKLYVSNKSPNTNFVQIYETKNTGEDSTIVYNLSNDKMYFFRIATFSAKGTLIGVSFPLMTSLGKEQNEYYSLSVKEKDHPLYFSNLSWKADGNNLAFVKADNSFSSNIYDLDINSFFVQQLTDYTSTDHRLMGISYSPNGDKIAFCYTPSITSGETNYRIWLLNIKDFEKEPVTSGRVDFDPTWLSNNTIVFSRGTHGPPNIPELFLYNSDNGTEKRITSDQKIYKYSPSFSASKNLIVYSGETSNRRYLYQISTSGENSATITENKFWKDLHPYWSNDGSKIFFTSNRSGHYEIWSVDALGTNYKQITYGLKKGQNRFYGRIDPNNKYMAIMENNLNGNHMLKLLYFNQ